MNRESMCAQLSLHGSRLSLLMITVFGLFSDKIMQGFMQTSSFVEFSINSRCLCYNATVKMAAFCLLQDPNLCFPSGSTHILP